MTTPMMTIESVQKAERLIQERNRITAAKWNAIIYDPNVRERSILRREMGPTEPVDEQLAWQSRSSGRAGSMRSTLSCVSYGIDPAEQNSAA
jgi:hypothetical protein